MARLPDPQALGQAPTPQVSGPVAQIPNAGAAEIASVQASREGVGEIADQLAQAGERIMSREEDIQSLKIARDLREKIDAKTRETLTRGDLSDPQTAAAHNAAVGAMVGESLGSFSGRPEARTKLSANLDDQRFRSTVHVANASTKAQDTLMLNEIDYKRNEVAGKMLLSNNFIGGVEEFNAFVDARRISPHLKAAIKTEGRGELAHQTIQSMLTRNQPGDAGKALQIFSTEAWSMGEPRRDSAQKMFFAIANDPDKKRERQISAAAKDLVKDQGMEPEAAIAWATGVIDKTITFKQEADGRVSWFNQLSGEVGVLDKPATGAGGAAGGTPTATPQKEPTIYENLTREGELPVSGPVGAVVTGASMVGSFLSPSLVAKNTVNTRDDLEKAKLELAVSMADKATRGGRDGKYILEKWNKALDIDAGLTRSDTWLANRLVEIDNKLRGDIVDELKLANGPGLTAEERSIHAEKAAAMQKFVDIVGVKHAALPPNIPPGSTLVRGKKHKSGRSLYVGPDGKTRIGE